MIHSTNGHTHIHIYTYYGHHVERHVLLFLFFFFLFSFYLFSIVSSSYFTLLNLAYPYLGPDEGISYAGGTHYWTGG